MFGVILFILFTVSGLPAAQYALPRSGRMARVWLGLVLGQIMMLWFPSLFAFLLDFTLAAQIAAAALALAVGGCFTVLCVRRGKANLPDAEPGKPETAPPLWLVAALVVPLTAFMGYLQYTHILLPEDGYLMTGQATNGDLNLHLAIASCLAGGGRFPPDYPIYDGVRLGYNFLSDAQASTMMTAGSSLRLSFILPAVFQTALAGWGFLIFAWEMCRSKRAAALAFLLLFLNGGLGFLYTLDRAVSDPSRLWNALFGFYQAPANMPSLNLRWSNILCDMLLPQRALLPGWMALTACLWLLQRAMMTRDIRKWILLGVIAGSMPMIHAHSLFSLALISFAAMAYCMAKKKGLTGYFLLYALITAALVIPQALYWILPQAAGGSMHLQFDWVNNENGRLIDEWFWFWIKNVGPVFLVFVPSYFIAPRRARPAMWGALLVFAAADLIVFQKNVYDNNKIFYAAFLTALPCAAMFLVTLYDKLKDLPGRRVFAGVFIAVCLASGLITCAREAISSYPLYSPEEVRAMDWIEENTEKDALFLTGDEYDNPVCALAGRNIYCGTGSFLYYHSIDYWDRAEVQRQILRDPEGTLELCRNYGIQYVYAGEYEIHDCQADIQAMARVYEPVYSDSVYIFRVPEA